MKYRRSTVILLVLFPAMLVAGVISWCFFPPESGRSFRFSLVRPSVLDDTVRIILRNQETPFMVDLRRTDEGWDLAVDGNHRFRADQRKIGLLFDGLTRARKGTRTPLTSSVKAEKELDRATEIALVGRNGQNLATIRFGLPSADGTSRQLCFTGSAFLWHAANDFGELLDMRASYWADLRIFRSLFGDAEIQRTVYRKGGFSHELLTGTVPGTERLSHELENLVCLDVTNIDAVPDEILTIETGDTREWSIRFARLTDDYILMEIGETGSSYIISSSAKERIDRSIGLK
jgi:hypothetical protein